MCYEIAGLSVPRTDAGQICAKIAKHIRVIVYDLIEPPSEMLATNSQLASKNYFFPLLVSILELVSFNTRIKLVYPSFHIYQVELVFVRLKTLGC